MKRETNAGRKEKLRAIVDRREIYIICMRVSVDNDVSQLPD